MKFLPVVILIFICFSGYARKAASVSDTLSNEALTQDRQVRMTNAGSISNHPNPFSDRTNIRYSVSENGMVELKILNAAGKLIKPLVSEFKSAGYYSIIFEPEDLNSGIYFVQLTVNGKSIIKKINILK